MSLPERTVYASQNQEKITKPHLKMESLEQAAFTSAEYSRKKSGWHPKDSGRNFQVAKAEAKQLLLFLVRRYHKAKKWYTAED